MVLELDHLASEEERNKYIIEYGRVLREKQNSGFVIWKHNATCILWKLTQRSSVIKSGETLDCCLADIALWNNHEALKLGCSA